MNSLSEVKSLEYDFCKRNEERTLFLGSASHMVYRLDTLHPS